MKYRNKSERPEYKRAFNQINLGATYEDAKRRMALYPEYAEKKRNIVKDCPAYESEDEAVEAALKLWKNGISCCKIWAEIKKDKEYYRINTNRWLIAYESETLKAAEDVGMVVMYDYLDFLDINHKDSD
jgi:hypothetical protein